MDPVNPNQLQVPGAEGWTILHAFSRDSDDIERLISLWGDIHFAATRSTQSREDFILHMMVRPVGLIWPTEVMERLAEAHVRECDSRHNH